jgi:hypothetical protein
MASTEPEAHSGMLKLTSIHEQQKLLPETDTVTLLGFPGPKFPGPYGPVAVTVTDPEKPPWLPTPILPPTIVLSLVDIDDGRNSSVNSPGKKVIVVWKLRFHVFPLASEEAVPVTVIVNCWNGTFEGALAVTVAAEHSVPGVLAKIVQGLGEERECYHLQIQ